MASSSSFYVHLPSNTIVSGNRTCEFLVRLSKTLRFNSEWSVGLAVMSYPHSWPSIGTNEEQFILLRFRFHTFLEDSDFVDKLLPSTIKILVPKSKHFNADRLEDALMQLIRAQGDELAKSLDEQILRVQDMRILQSLDPIALENRQFDFLIQKAKERSEILKSLGNYLHVEYYPNFQRFRFHYNLPKNADDSEIIEHVEVSQQLSYVLGLEGVRLPPSGNYAAYAPDMLGGISSLYVYAPGLIEPVMIGDTSAPLLRTVHVKGQPDENVEDIYAAIQYHKLLIKEVSEIKIEIRTPSGRLVPFEYGNCLLTLHFRKLPYY